MSKRKQMKSIEASEWWVKLRDEDCTDREREMFVDWLRAAPENVSEYLALANVWQDLGEVVPNTEINEILAELSNDNVVPYPNLSEVADRPKASPKQWRQSWFAIAATVALFTVATLLVLQQSGNTLETAVGEQRTVVLEDGSVLTLNTRTRLQYEISTLSRNVVLIEGEALFDVARDINRPFIVTVGPTTVRVLGTSFNIYKTSDSESTITVLEGLVVVNPQSNTELLLRSAGDLLAETGDIKLTVGEQLHISSEETIVPKSAVSTDKTIEWTSRRLSFENTVLKDVIFEFNRYNVKQLQVEDAELAMLRLNGVFEPNGHETLLDYLRKTENVHIRDIGNRRVISR